MCSGIGYRGRTGIYEMLMVDDPVRQLTLEKADAIEDSGVGGLPVA